MGNSGKAAIQNSMFVVVVTDVRYLTTLNQLSKLYVYRLNNWNYIAPADRMISG
jgi:hypothetical protein